MAPETIVAAVAQKTRLNTKLEVAPDFANSLKFVKISRLGTPIIPIT